MLHDIPSLSSIHTVLLQHMDYKDEKACPHFEELLPPYCTILKSLPEFLSNHTAYSFQNSQHTSCIYICCKSRRLFRVHACHPLIRPQHTSSPRPRFHPIRPISLRIALPSQPSASPSSDLPAHASFYPLPFQAPRRPSNCRPQENSPLSTSASSALHKPLQPILDDEASTDVDCAASQLLGQVKSKLSTPRLPRRASDSAASSPASGLATRTRTIQGFSPCSKPSRVSLAGTLHVQPSFYNRRKRRSGLCSRIGDSVRSACGKARRRS